MKKVFIIAAFMLCQSIVLLSKTKDSTVYSIDEVLITANKPLKHTGLQLAKIDSIILYENISQTMADILSKNATIFVKNYGKATESTAEFRGTSASHTQVLWNGMRLNSPMLGTVDFSFIPSFLIDDASLYYGASSINLSSGGLGGAVELSSNILGLYGWEAQYIGGYGSFNTFDQFAKLCYGNKNWKTSTRFFYSTSKNNYKYINYDKMIDVYKDGVIVNSYHPEERNKSGYYTDMHLLQDINYNNHNGHNFNISVWYINSLRGLPFLSVDYREDTYFKNEQDNQTVRTVASWRYLKPKFKIDSKIGYNHQDISYDYYTINDKTRSDITHSNSKSNSFYGQINTDFFPSSKLLFSASITTYYNMVRSIDKTTFSLNNSYDKSRLELSAYVSAKWRANERFSISASIREEAYGTDILTPATAVFAEYIINKKYNIIAKASIANNYRYPSMDDLYFKPGGNPDLNPEHGFTYDGGIEWDIRRKKYHFKGNVSLFNSYIKDWILWTPTMKGFWSPSNVKKVHNYGAEVALINKWNFSNQFSIGFDAGFGWTPSKNYGEKRNTNDNSYGKQLCYIPIYSASAQLNFNYKTWSIGYKWNYYSERFTTTSNEPASITGRLKPYFMNSASIEKGFHLLWGDISLKGVVNNLLNAKYVTVLSRPMPGINYEVFISIRPKWGKK